MSRDELQTSFDFEESARSGGARAVAAAIAGHHADHPEAGGLVIVLSPETDDRQVLAGGAEGALRAAISSAVSSGHEEIWAPAPTDGSTVALDLRTLPDIVRAAVDGAGIVDIHVAAVERDDRIACCVLWLDQGTGAPTSAARRSNERSSGHLQRRLKRQLVSVLPLVRCSSGPAPT